MFQKEPNEVGDNDKQRLALINERREHREEGKYRLLLHPTRRRIKPQRPGKAAEGGRPGQGFPGTARRGRGSAREARTGGAGDRSLPHPQKALGAEAAAAVG